MSSKARIYLPFPGKNARLAADSCQKGDWERAIKRLHLAAADCELMHPTLWPCWSNTSDDLFAKALAYVSREEMELLRNFQKRGPNLVCHLAASSAAKLQSLASVGLELGGSPTAWLNDVELSMEPAMWCAAQGRLFRLFNLMRAGAPAPKPLSAEEAAHFSQNHGAKMRSALHFLACVPYDPGSSMEPDNLTEMVEWLDLGGSKNMRISDGRDALGVAIDKANARMIKSLLAAGADPRRQDAKGRDAVALLERRLKAFAVHGESNKVKALKSVQSLLRAVVERRTLGETASPVEARSVRARSL